MFDTRNNKYPDQIDVNTDGIALAGNCLMRLDWWKRFISIKMFPARSNADLIQQGTGSRYDKDRVQITLSATNASILARWLEEVFIPACKEQKEAHFGVICSRINILYFDTHSDGVFRPNVRIYMSLSDARIPAKMMTYYFEPLKGVSYYNHNTGEIQTEDSYIHSIGLVANLFKASALVLFGAVEHAASMSSAERNERVDNLFKYIAQKNGLTYETAVKNYYNSRPKDIQYSNDDSASNPPPKLESNISTASSIDDLNSLL